MTEQRYDAVKEPLSGFKESGRRMSHTVENYRESELFKLGNLTDFP